MKRLFAILTLVLFLTAAAGQVFAGGFGHGGWKRIQSAQRPQWKRLGGGKRSGRARPKLRRWDS
jgi:hypothetical protein